VKKISNHTHKAGFWYLLRVLFKISDKQRQSLPRVRASFFDVFFGGVGWGGLGRLLPHVSAERNDYWKYI